MKRSSWLVLTLSLFAAAAYGAPGGTLLTVRVPGNSDYNYTLAQLQRFPERTVKAGGPGGEEHSYAGVALGDLLRDAGMPGGADLHGRYLRYYAVAQAADRYSVVFALPELDPAYIDKTVLVAWARDGQPLPAEEGPLAIVVPEGSSGMFASPTTGAAAGTTPPAPPGPGTGPSATPSGPGAAPGMSAPTAGAGWQPGAPTWREERRAEQARRRAERAAWRAQRRAARGGRPDDSTIIAGVVLIVLGAVFFASQLLPAFNWAFAWPVALIALGALLIIRSARDRP